MFTGIIQNQAVVLKKIRQGSQIRFVFKLEHPEKRKWSAGESIAVNGVCLTAAEIGRKTFAADVIPETLHSTALSGLEVRSRVNIERSLKMGDPFGGHFVTGHVDGCGRIVKIQRRGRNRLLTLRAPASILKLIAPKGSIAVDGISLTVQGRSGRDFKVAIVPYTLRQTTLADKKKGDNVNLEVDILTRYLNIFSESMPLSGKKSRKSLLKIAGLKKQGF